MEFMLVSVTIAGIGAWRYITRKKRHPELAVGDWPDVASLYSEEYIKEMNARVEAARRKQKQMI
jgi:hypothetical protein